MAGRFPGEGPPSRALHLWVPFGYFWAGRWAGIPFGELPAYSEPFGNQNGADQLLFLASVKLEPLLPSRKTKLQCF